MEGKDAINFGPRGCGRPRCGDGRCAGVEGRPTSPRAQVFTRLDSSAEFKKLHIPALVTGRAYAAQPSSMRRLLTQSLAVTASTTFHNDLAGRDLNGVSAQVASRFEFECVRC